MEVIGRSFSIFSLTLPSLPPTRRFCTTLLLAKKKDIQDNNNNNDSQPQPPFLSFRVSNSNLARAAIGVFALGFIDSGYSGDWSRIGAITPQTEELLRLAAFIVVPIFLWYWQQIHFRLIHFPDVMRKMDKPLKIHLINASIEEFPESIGNFIGLEYMSTCEQLRNLSRFLLLPKLTTLKVDERSQLGESFRRFKVSHSVGNGCPNVKELFFSKANLSCEDPYKILEIFSKLEYLNVSHNGFVSLHKCIEGSSQLKSLDKFLLESYGHSTTSIKYSESRCKILSFLNSKSIKHAMVQGFTKCSIIVVFFHSLSI